MSTIPIPQRVTFEAWVIAHYPKLFAAWETECAEFMELDEWAEKQHPELIDAWRKAQRATHGT